MDQMGEIQWHLSYLAIVIDFPDINHLVLDVLKGSTLWTIPVPQNVEYEILLDTIQASVSVFLSPPFPLFLVFILSYFFNPPSFLIAVGLSQVFQVYIREGKKQKKETLNK